MINNIVLVGRIANGLELKEAGKGKVANISIAVQSKYKDANGEYKTNFFDCELWNKRAENAIDFFKIGDVVSVTGSVDIDTYEKNGEKRKSFKVIPDTFSLVSPAKERNKEQEKNSMEEINNNLDKDITDDMY